MRCLGALVLSVSAVGWVLPGCVADHASAIDKSETTSDRVVEIPDKPADPNDPFGSCKDPVPDGSGWPSCSIEGAGCWGWGEMGECEATECEYLHLWQICRHSCEVASDCPVPLTGDSVPACMDGHCTLPCGDEDTVCPDGFLCANVNQIEAESDPYGWICMQYESFEPYVPGP